MAIENPEAIRFVNEQVRPSAEKIRGLKAEIDATMVAWFAGVDASIPNDAREVLADGREGEGVSRLTGADIHNFMARLASIQEGLSGKETIIEKPCVRPLKVG